MDLLPNRDVTLKPLDKGEEERIRAIVATYLSWDKLVDPDEAVRKTAEETKTDEEVVWGCIYASLLYKLKIA